MKKKDDYSGGKVKKTFRANNCGTVVICNINGILEGSPSVHTRERQRVKRSSGKEFKESRLAAKPLDFAQSAHCLLSC